MRRHDVHGCRQNCVESINVGSRVLMLLYCTRLLDKRIVILKDSKNIPSHLLLLILDDEPWHDCGT